MYRVLIYKIKNRLSQNGSKMVKVYFLDLMAVLKDHVKNSYLNLKPI